MRWAGYVVRMGYKRNLYIILLGIKKEIDNKEEVDMGGRIRLKWFLKT
jgi:hypothetical protein